MSAALLRTAGTRALAGAAASALGLRRSLAAHSHRGDPRQLVLGVDADALGVRIEERLDLVAPSELILVADGVRLAGVPVETSDGRLRAVIDEGALATAMEVVVRRRAEASDAVDQDAAGDEPEGEGAEEATQETVGALVRLAWSWPATDGLPPEHCSSVVLEDGSVVGRRTWRASVEAASDAETMATRGEERQEPLAAASGIVWVGRARTTRFGTTRVTAVGEHTVRPYVNRRGYVSVAIDRVPSPTITAYADAVGGRSGELSVAGHLRSRFGRIDRADLVLAARISGTEFSSPARLRFDASHTAHDHGRGHYAYRAAVAIDPTRWDEVDAADNYDVSLRLWLTGTEEPVLVRINKIPRAVRMLTQAGTATSGDRVLSVAPYYTFKAKALSAKLEVFPLGAYEAMTAPAPKASGDKPVWIIGELPYKAQDNGAHFFRWMRANRPEIDAYYVIDRDSPERANLGGDDHVVDHGSAEHVRLALVAERFVGSHHPDFLYPTRNPDFVRRLTGARVFLQHGVMGTKWMVPNYGKNAAGFSTDLFLASSEREKSYLVSDFGYAPEEVVVTGLPRFDRLLDPSVRTNPRQLLIMPTWRDWLQTEDAFLDSEYFRRWHGLLTSVAFADIVKRHSLEVVLCLHPNMQRFTEAFRGVPARVVSQGEENVQDLMMASACMITDYSSVGFDFSFQHRPVIYFQFDRDAFIGPKGSHLDLDAELPGVIARDEAEVLSDLEALADTGFSQNDDLRRRSDRFLDHHDRNANERVFRAVLGARRGREVASGELSGVPEAVFRRFRRHRAYYPLMKRLSAAARRLPVRGDVLVFESGLGKQYADSPRYIYEELVARGDTRTKVWVYSGPHRFTDPTTITVKRLSPSYYWYMARAGILTLNQSAPFYLKRHPRAKYVQTWHGTPLKKMQHDIEEVHGRDDGYLDRVTAQTRQWTHLLSPSDYATEAFRSAFRYSGEVVRLGYPRNDPLLGEGASQLGKDVRHRLRIDPQAPVVLYAPTFRDNQAKKRGGFGFELPFDLAEFMARLPADAVLLLRMHVLVSSALKIPEELADRVIDVSSYPEIQELYLVSDVLVTDYSSVFFDAAVLRRPIVFHAYDLEEYRDTLRGFYLDYEASVPGPVTRTPVELAAAVNDGLLHGIDEAKRDAFIQRFAPLDDGHAAARVVDALYGE